MESPFMKHFCLFGFVAALLFTSALAFGQATSGDFAGTVMDFTSAVIPNAIVVAKNEGTGVVYTAKASASGEVRIANLPPGAYDITVTASGFSPFTLKGLAIDLNKTSSSTFKLMAASANSVVEVSAVAAVTLDTTSTNLTQTFE